MSSPSRAALLNKLNKLLAMYPTFPLKTVTTQVVETLPKDDDEPPDADPASRIKVRNVPRKVRQFPPGYMEQLGEVFTLLFRPLIANSFGSTIVWDAPRKGNRADQEAHDVFQILVADLLASAEHRARTGSCVVITATSYLHLMVLGARRFKSLNPIEALNAALDDHHGGPEFDSVLFAALQRAVRAVLGRLVRAGHPLVRKYTEAQIDALIEATATRLYDLFKQGLIFQSPVAPTTPVRLMDPADIPGNPEDNDMGVHVRGAGPRFTTAEEFRALVVQQLEETKNQAPTSAEADPSADVLPAAPHPAPAAAPPPSGDEPPTETERDEHYECVRRAINEFCLQLAGVIRQPEYSAALKLFTTLLFMPYITRQTQYAADYRMSNGTVNTAKTKWAEYIVGRCPRWSGLLTAEFLTKLRHLHTLFARYMYRCQFAEAPARDQISLPHPEAGTVLFEFWQFCSTLRPCPVFNNGFRIDVVGPNPSVLPAGIVEMPNAASGDSYLILKYLKPMAADHGEPTHV